MPTGYTADVEDGKLTELRDYALMCARAFGALIMMRDDPLDAPIPDEFKPSEYYTQQIQQLGDDLGNLEALTPTQCLAAQNDEIAKARKYRDNYLAMEALKRGRYDAMRAKVRAWKPPAELQALKNFMVEQIDKSTLYGSTYEPSVPVLRDPLAWRAAKVAELKADLARANDHLAGERERNKERTEWVKLLKASL